jgi:predicted dehydrogenase
MRQILAKNNKIELVEIPAPKRKKGRVLIKVMYSAISPGTESLAVKSTSNVIKKVTSNTVNARKGFNYLKEKGIYDTYNEYKKRTSSYTELGYSISGIVVETGEEIENIKVGDYVAAAGAGEANHAEYVSVSKNLIVKISDSKFIKEASTVTLGAIAMQGFRRSNLQLGEVAAVIGCGTLGLLCISILRAAGIRVIAIDISEEKLKIAEKLGCEKTILNADYSDYSSRITKSYPNGIDCSLFCAQTDSKQATSSALKILKRKGKFVLVGQSNLDLDRNDLYEKEIDFLISTSYGPGRYDPIYEDKGIDYPFGYVRWTENRNMQSYLNLIFHQKIDLKHILDEPLQLEKWIKGGSIDSSSKIKLQIIDFNLKSNLELRTKITNSNVPNRKKITSKILNVAIIGVGDFAATVHIPNIIRLYNKLRIRALCSNSGVKLKQYMDLYKIDYITTNSIEIINDPLIDIIFVCTNHGSHAQYIKDIIKAGKYVFVEKPLCINNLQLDSLKKLHEEVNLSKKLFIGFNRRFSIHTQYIKSKLTNTKDQPIILTYVFNAGYMPLNHWVHNDGGRFVGEACHAIDLCSYFIDSKIINWKRTKMISNNTSYKKTDNQVLTINYECGSIATIIYHSIGSKKYEKERIELNQGGQTIIQDNFKKTTFFEEDKIIVKKSKKIDKGHHKALLSMYESIVNDNLLFDFQDIHKTTEISIIEEN